jgi:nitroreductase
MPNPVIECLMAHRSIRKFKPQPIEPETLDLILKAGVRAATAGNLQHYSLIVVDDHARKRALWDEDDVDNPTFIISLVDEYRLKRWFELNEAPFYFDKISNLLIGYWDAIIALHNIVIAAESLGLGAVYIGEIISMDIQTVLGTPEYVFPAGMIWIGYPDETPELRPRLPLEAVVHHNGYQIPCDDEIRTFFKDKDLQWEKLPENRRKALEAQGIHNWAQRTTLGHYSEAIITADCQKVITNIRAAKFQLS